MESTTLPIGSTNNDRLIRGGKNSSGNKGKVQSCFFEEDSALKFDDVLSGASCSLL